MEINFCYQGFPILKLGQAGFLSAEGFGWQLRHGRSSSGLWTELPLVLGGALEVAVGGVHEVCQWDRTWHRCHLTSLSGF